MKREKKKYENRSRVLLEKKQSKAKKIEGPFTRSGVAGNKVRICACRDAWLASPAEIAFHFMFSWRGRVNDGDGNHEPRGACWRPIFV